MTKRKVLLLGGSGYLGAQILRYLEQDQENEIVATCFSTSTSLHTNKARAILQTTFRNV
ncbi:hypothetical protein [Brevibacillus choshinensis]|uniref:hypothetical protein n=1 Tax=Brevibacillus choshinensis TaxID=54911 RepID=UPI002E1B4AE9|nr:hypothetical protein [Brevibacillus choshinensis]MED4752820.1 hypothetical protein [Brevibacillus choshinensis]